MTGPKKIGSASRIGSKFETPKPQLYFLYLFVLFYIYRLHVYIYIHISNVLLCWDWFDQAWVFSHKKCEPGPWPSQAALSSAMPPEYSCITWARRPKWWKPTWNPQLDLEDVLLYIICPYILYLLYIIIIMIIIIILYYIVLYYIILYYNYIILYYISSTVEDSRVLGFQIGLEGHTQLYTRSRYQGEARRIGGLIFRIYPQHKYFKFNDQPILCLFYISGFAVCVFQLSAFIPGKAAWKYMFIPWDKFGLGVGVGGLGSVWAGWCWWCCCCWFVTWW